jgi:hypothetical protein
VNSIVSAVHSCRSLVLSLVALGATFVARGDEWAPNLTAAAVWHSNASHADNSDDQLDSLQLKADILASKRYAFGRDDALHLSGHFAGDWWPRYNRLLSGAAGGRAEWRHQFGPSPLAPIVSIEGAADAVAARENGRGGTHAGATASVRKRFNDRLRASLAHEVAWLFARESVYDAGSSESSAEIDYDVNPRTRVTFGIRFRDGDVVTHATGARPDLEGLATRFLPVTTFDRAMTAYRVDAKTWSGRIALVRALDDHSAIVLAYERRESERKSLRFENDLLSVGFVHQF